MGGDVGKDPQPSLRATHCGGFFVFAEPGYHSTALSLEPALCTYPAVQYASSCYPNVSSSVHGAPLIGISSRWPIKNHCNPRRSYYALAPNLAHVGGWAGAFHQRTILGTRTMTNEHVQIAAQLMEDAYKAGYAGKPIEQVDTSHGVLWMQYHLGKYHAEMGKPSVFERHYGVVAV